MVYKGVDMKNIKISIIIPVYKVEKYIHQCVASVLKQSYKNTEIILVDDGSPDNCPQICDDYAKNNKSVIVLHKSNGGLSDARNEGIKIATGDYIMFLDSDDHWDETEGLKDLVDKLEENEVDALIFRYKKYYENSSKFTNPINILDSSKVSFKSKNDAFLYMLDAGAFIASAWNKIIKRSLFDLHDLFFKIGITSEDIDWCARLAIASDSFDVSNCCFYVYRQRNDSITHSMSIKNIKDLKENVLRCILYGNEIQNSDSDFKTLYLNYVAYQYMTFLVCCHFVKDTEVNKLVDEMKEYSYLLNYDRNKKVKIFKNIYKAFGYKFLYRSIGLYLSFI
jgi:glycosyltransferase involved in cell wall biosynthesis